MILDLEVSLAGAPSKHDDQHETLGACERGANPLMRIPSVSGIPFIMPEQVPTDKSVEDGCC